MVTDCSIPASVWKPGRRQVAELWGSKPDRGRKSPIGNHPLLPLPIRLAQDSSWEYFLLSGWHIEICKPLSVEQKLLRVYFFLTWVRAHGKILKSNFASNQRSEWVGGGVVGVHLYSDVTGKEQRGLYSDQLSQLAQKWGFLWTQDFQG